MYQEDLMNCFRVGCLEQLKNLVLVTRVGDDCAVDEDMGTPQASLLCGEETESV